MCVADLDGDRKAKLAFTYSWGSGIHRSVVGIWTGGDSWIDASPRLRDYDLALEKIDDEHVDLAYGEFFPPNTFKRQGTFGKLRLTPGNPNPALDVVLNSQLPAEVINRIWK